MQVPISPACLGKPAQQRGQVGRADERVHAFARLQFVHPVGQAPHALVQIVQFLVALVETALQIQMQMTPQEVDAFAGQFVDEFAAGSMSACEVHARVAARALGCDRQAPSARRCGSVCGCTPASSAAHADHVGAGSDRSLPCPHVFRRRRQLSSPDATLAFVHARVHPHIDLDLQVAVTGPFDARRAFVFDGKHGAVRVPAGTFTRVSPLSGAGTTVPDRRRLGHRHRQSHLHAAPPCGNRPRGSIFVVMSRSPASPPVCEDRPCP